MEKAMKIMRNLKDLPTMDGPSDTFTGKVKISMLYRGEEPSESGAAHVCFDCCARSAWHTHPKGQLLIVTEGSGLIQEWGKDVQRIEKGDVIWTPPGVKHWHGASQDSSMSHIAVQEALNGKPVEWMEKVTDEQYQAPAEDETRRQ